MMSHETTPSGFAGVVLWKALRGPCERLFLRPRTGWRRVDVIRLVTCSFCVAFFAGFIASHYVDLFLINMISSKQTATLGRVPPHTVKRTQAAPFRCSNSSEQKSRQIEPQQSRRAVLACLSAFCALQTPGR